MKLQIMSDIHNEFARYEPPEVDADVTILAGDIDTEGAGVAWARETFARPVIYVPGNHEYYSNQKTVQKINAEMKASAAGSKVHVLLDEALVIGDVRFLCGTLWTDFRLYGNPVLAAELARQGMADYRFSRIADDAAEKDRVRMMRPMDTYSWHCATRAFLGRNLAQPFDGKTVVVTHHAPARRCIPARFKGDGLSACFASDLEALMGPAVDLWAYGHTHEARDMSIRGTRVVCNQRGYAPHMLVKNFNEWFVVEV
jgi:predicted phosphodiesterase